MNSDEYRAARVALGWSQKRLAEYLDRHISIISKRERGLKPITREAELAIGTASAIGGNKT